MITHCMHDISSTSPHSYTKLNRGDKSRILILILGFKGLLKKDFRHKGYIMWDSVENYLFVFNVVK